MFTAIRVIAGKKKIRKRERKIKEIVKKERKKERKKKKQTDKAENFRLRRVLNLCLHSSRYASAIGREALFPKYEVIFRSSRLFEISGWSNRPPRPIKERDFVMRQNGGIVWPYGHSYVVCYMSFQNSIDEIPGRPDTSTKSKNNLRRMFSLPLK